MHDSTATLAPPHGGFRHRSRRRAGRLLVPGAAALFAVGAVALPAAASGTGHSTAAATHDFTQTNLVANKASFGAKLVDPNLTNAWGLAASAGSPLWVSDNNSGKASVYGGGIGGSAVTLDLTVPVPGGNPTGQVFNPASKAFPVGGPSGSSAIFIVSTDSIGATQSPGEIAGMERRCLFRGGRQPHRGAWRGHRTWSRLQGLGDIADADRRT